MVKVLTVLALILIPASFVSVRSQCAFLEVRRPCADGNRISFSWTMLAKYHLPASSSAQKMTYRSMLSWQSL